MIKKSKNKIIQSGVIPFTIKNNKLRLLIITNSRRDKWLFPKGIVEKNMTNEESAAMEAYEEAGVIGEVLLMKIGSYNTNKNGGVCKIDMFPLLIDKIMNVWPEKKIRKRKLINPDEIGDYIKDKKLLKIVEKFNSLEYYKLL